MKNGVTEMVVLDRIDANINFNYEETENYLEGLLKDFSGWQIQDADLVFAKETLAGLNKLTKSVEDFRKTNKKEMEKPIKEFEEKCKKLTSKISKVYDPLKIQFDGFEEKRRQEKEKELQELLEQVKNDSNLPKQYLCNIVLKPAYMNKTSTKKSIIEDLWAQVEAVSNKIKEDKEKDEYIEVLCEAASLKFNLEVKLDPHNFSNFDREVLKERIEQSAERMKQNEIETIERIKKQEELKAQKEAEITIIETTSAMQKVVDEIIVVEDLEEKILSTILEISATKTQMMAMKKYMEMAGIKYKRFA